MPNLNLIPMLDPKDVVLTPASFRRSKWQTSFVLFGRVLYFSALAAGLVAIRFAFMSSYV